MERDGERQVGGAIQKTHNIYRSSLPSYIMPQNNHNSDIKDHWSQIIITNLIMMKTFEVLYELPECGTETQVSKYYWKYGPDRLALCRIATNIQFTKNAMFAKYNKTKHNKMSMPVYCCVTWFWKFLLKTTSN